ncbi:5846_t:CDS:2, partial [Funneliformis mosseae]
QSIMFTAKPSKAIFRMKKSIKFTTYLLQKTLYSSIRPRNLLKNQISCHAPYTSQIGSLARSFFTSALPPVNKIFLNQPSFILSPQIYNKERYFNNSFSKNFLSTTKAFKPHSSKSQKFFDSTTSINKPTSTTGTSSTSTAISTSHQNHSSIIDFYEKPLSITKRNSFILNHGGSGIPKHSEKLITTKNDGEYYSVGCGEDSFFVRYDSLGVADGVGGWRN